MLVYVKRCQMSNLRSKGCVFRSRNGAIAKDSRVNGIAVSSDGGTGTVVVEVLTGMQFSGREWERCRWTFSFSIQHIEIMSYKWFSIFSLKYNYLQLLFSIKLSPFSVFVLKVSKYEYACCLGGRLTVGLAFPISTKEHVVTCNLGWWW